MSAPSSRGVNVEFDPSLVRGMGYYTGPIFELWHPSSKGAIAGGGRYDNMISRFLSTDRAGVGFSIGFERILEMISAPNTSERPKVAIVYDETCPTSVLLSAQSHLVGEGATARIVRRQRNMAALLSSLADDEFTEWTEIDSSGALGEMKPIK